MSERVRENRQAEVDMAFLYGVLAASDETRLLASSTSARPGSAT